MKLDTNLLTQAANQARGLAIDAIHKCASGHLGLPLGAAEIGATLYGALLSHNPDEPRWLNRDRFILSAGHGSMFLYTWLHLAGYDLPLEELKNFRQLHSKTPGHPEFRETPGVECTTGPLGQGIANAVGFAISGKMAAARFNTPGHTVFDSHIITLAGDGCMQEGVALEAIAFAGHQKLDNLILLFDSNDVTLDAMANKTQSDDVAKRFKALHWDVQTIDGHDLTAIAKALNKAKRATTGHPQLIIARTTIAKGIPEVAGTSKGHGEGGAKFADAARAGLGLPADQHFYVSEEVRAYFAAHKKRLVRNYKKWLATFEAWQAANPGKAALLATRDGQPGINQLLENIPAFPSDAKLATRAAGQAVLQPLAAALPLLIGGSADLYGSTLNYIAGDKDFAPGPAPAPATRPEPANTAPRAHPAAPAPPPPLPPTGPVATSGSASGSTPWPPSPTDSPTTAYSDPRSPPSSYLPTTRDPRCASPRWPNSPSSTFTRTTPSASARTAPRTSRSRRFPACASSRTST
jgi:transketolase